MKILYSCMFCDGFFYIVFEVKQHSNHAILTFFISFIHQNYIQLILLNYNTHIITSCYNMGIISSNTISSYV